MLVGDLVSWSRWAGGGAVRSVTLSGRDAADPGARASGSAGAADAEARGWFIQFVADVFQLVRTGTVTALNWLAVAALAAVTGPAVQMPVSSSPITLLTILMVRGLTVRMRMPVV